MERSLYSFQRSYRLIFLSAVLLIIIASAACAIKLDSGSGMGKTLATSECIDKNAVAQVCGLKATSAVTQADTVLDLVTQPGKSASVEASGAGVIPQAVNLFGSRCELKLLTPETEAKIKSSSGNAFINSFRFGIGSTFEDNEVYRNLLPLSDAQCNINPKATASDKRIDRFMNYLDIRNAAIAGYNPSIGASGIIAKEPSGTTIEKLKLGDEMTMADYFFLKDASYITAEEHWTAENQIGGWGTISTLGKPDKYFYRNYLKAAWAMDYISKTFTGGPAPTIQNSNDPFYAEKTKFADPEPHPYECESSTDCYSGICDKSFYSRGYCYDETSGNKLGCECYSGTKIIGSASYSGIFCTVNDIGHPDKSFYLKQTATGYIITAATGIFQEAPVNSFTSLAAVGGADAFKGSTLVQACGMVEGPDYTIPGDVIIQSLGKCRLDPTTNTLETGQYGWCQPCTLSTMANQNAYNAPTINCANGLRIPYNGVEYKIGDFGVISWASSKRQYCHYISEVVGEIQSDRQDGKGNSAWPAQLPHFGMVERYTDAYLQSNILPTLTFANDLRYDWYGGRNLNNGIFSVYPMLFANTKASNRGSVMITLQQLTDSDTIDDLAKKIVFYNDGAAAAKNLPGDPTLIYAQGRGVEGCRSCLFGLKLNSSLFLGNPGSPSTPSEYKDAVIAKLEDYFGGDAPSASQVNIDEGIDYVVIDFPAHEYYRFVQNTPDASDMSFERTYQEMMNIQTNISRTIYDRWKKFTVIDPFWGVEQGNYLVVHEQYPSSATGPAGSAGTSIHYDASYSTYLYTSGATTDQELVRFNVPDSGKAELDVNYWGVTGPVIFQSSLYLNGNLQSGFACIGTCMYAEKTIPGSQLVNGQNVFRFTNAASGTPYLHFTLKYATPTQGLFGWTETKQANLLRFMLENRRQLTDAVTAGMNIRNITNSRSSVDLSVPGVSGASTEIPLIWQNGNSHEFSKVAIVLQKYARLLTGQKDRIIYTRSYAKDSCNTVESFDPATGNPINVPDDNCILTKYPGLDKIPYCSKCSEAEMDADMCGASKITGPRGINCLVPTGEDPNHYRFDPNSETAVENLYTQAFNGFGGPGALTRDPSGQLRCGLCENDTRTGICEITNSFTNTLLSRYPFSVDKFSENDLDLLPNTYDTAGNNVLCCLIDKRFNPNDQMSNNQDGNANITNYFSYLKKKYYVLNPELIVFPKSSGISLENAVIGKPEKAQKIFNFALIDDEREVRCDMKVVATTIYYCYDKDDERTGFMRNQLDNGAFIERMFDTIRNEIDPTYQSLIVFSRKDVSPAQLKESDCTLFITSDRKEYTEDEIMQILDHLDRGGGLLMVNTGIASPARGITRQLELKTSTVSGTAEKIIANMSAITIDDEDNMILFPDTLASCTHDLSISSTYDSSAIVLSKQSSDRKVVMGKAGMAIYRFGRAVLVTVDLFNGARTSCTSNELDELFENIIRWTIRFGR